MNRPRQTEMNLPSPRQYRGSIRFALLTLASLSLAVTAGVNSLSNVLASANPALVMQTPFGNALASAYQADRLLTTNPALVLKPYIQALASTSLIGQPLNPKALRILGFSEAARGNAAGARRLIALSERTSRRDLGTQLWLIEDDVRHGSIAGALSHYDIAMRTNPESRELLFPVLTKALEARDVQGIFARYVKADNPWLPSFLNFAISQENPQNVVATLARSGGIPQSAAYQSVPLTLLNALIADGDYTGARNYYLSLPGSSAAIPVSADLSDAAMDQRFPPITWQLAESSALSASVERGDSGTKNAVRVLANSGERGVALRRVLFLKPGLYQMTEDRSVSQISFDAEAWWDLKCVADNKTISVWRTETDPPKSGNRSMPGVKIPAKCPVQFLDLNVAGGSDQAGLSMLVRSILLEPHH